MGLRVAPLRRGFVLIILHFRYVLFFSLTVFSHFTRCLTHLMGVFHQHLQIQYNRNHFRFTPLYPAGSKWGKQSRIFTGFTAAKNKIVESPPDFHCIYVQYIARQNTEKRNNLVQKGQPFCVEAQVVQSSAHPVVVLLRVVVEKRKLLNRSHIAATFFASPNRYVGSLNVLASKSSNFINFIFLSILNYYTFVFHFKRNFISS